MMMDKQIEELLPFYALDTLSDDERDLVEAFLQEHPEARLEVEALREAAAALPISVEPVTPLPGTRRKLMERIARDGRSQIQSGHTQFTWAALRPAGIFQVLSLGVAAVAILWAVLLNNQLAELRSEVAALRTAVISQADSLQQINRTIGEIHTQLPESRGSEVITVSIRGTELQPQAQGQLIADPDSSSAVLVIDGLSQLDEGLTYQVWLIGGDGPVSAGFLTVDERGQGVLIVSSEEAIGLFNALGISIEPAGGSPQPEGEIVVLSEL